VTGRKVPTLRRRRRSAAAPTFPHR